jgi:hypothetical protein
VVAFGVAVEESSARLAVLVANLDPEVRAAIDDVDRTLIVLLSNTQSVTDEGRLLRVLDLPTLITACLTSRARLARSIPIALPARTMWIEP